MWFWFINLLIPGGGVVLAGDLLRGTLLALLFSAGASVAIWAIWIIPETVAPWPWLKGVALATAAGTFVACQLQLAQSLRRRRMTLAADARRRVLETVSRQIDAGTYADALAALNPLAAQARDDLLVAFRRAQVLTLARHVHDARAAWRHLRAIDLHHIYRAEIEVHERALESQAADEPPRA